jgi:hypothetical protein
MTLAHIGENNNSAEHETEQPPERRYTSELVARTDDVGERLPTFSDGY